MTGAEPEPDLGNITNDVAKHVANLQMQVSALESITQDSSMLAMLKETRRTIRTSAMVIAVALVVSSVLKYCGDSRQQALEDRIQTLERNHATRP